MTRDEMPMAPWRPRLSSRIAPCRVNLRAMSMCLSWQVSCRNDVTHNRERFLLESGQVRDIYGQQEDENALNIRCISALLAPRGAWMTYNIAQDIRLSKCDAR